MRHLATSTLSCCGLVALSGCLTLPQFETSEPNEDTGNDPGRDTVTVDQTDLDPAPLIVETQYFAESMNSDTVTIANGLAAQTAIFGSVELPSTISPALDAWTTEFTLVDGELNAVRHRAPELITAHAATATFDPRHVTVENGEFSFGVPAVTTGGPEVDLRSFVLFSKRDATNESDIDGLLVSYSVDGFSRSIASHAESGAWQLVSATEDAFSVTRHSFGFDSSQSSITYDMVDPLIDPSHTSLFYSFVPVSGDTVTPEGGFLTCGLNDSGTIDCQRAVGGQTFDLRVEFQVVVWRDDLVRTDHRFIEFTEQRAQPLDDFDDGAIWFFGGQAMPVGRCFRTDEAYNLALASCMVSVANEDQEIRVVRGDTAIATDVWVQSLQNAE